MIFSANKLKFIPIDVLTMFIALFLLTTIIFSILISIKFKRKRKKAIGIWGLGWSLLTIILLITGTFGKFVKIDEANETTYTQKELTNDLNQLEETLMNENPLYFADKEKLNEKFQNVYDEIKNDMTELDFYRLVNPIVVDVKCGHTNLYISEGLEMNRKNTAKFFPLEVTLVNDELYFLEADIENSIEPGDKILSINGKTANEIISALIENISIDSDIESKARYIISKHFNSRFYDFVDNSDTFEIETINEENISKIINLEGKYRSEFNTNAWRLHFSEYGNYYEAEIYEDYAVLDLNVFMRKEDNKYDEFLGKFFQEINDKGISKIVIDIRGNFGGDPKMSKELLSYLVTEEVDYFVGNLGFIQNLVGYQKPVSPSEIYYDGDVVVLTDGAVFSTAGHFTAFVKYHNLATLVGSETGGTYVCTDSSKDIVLENTRIRLHYSTFIYKLAVEGFSERTGIIPDQVVSPTIDDIITNKDVIMEQGIKALGL